MFQAVVRGGATGLIVIRDPLTNTLRPQIVALAARHRLPAMYASREFIDAGGLMVYGSNVFDLYRRTAAYVDKILKGAKPSELPVEQRGAAGAGHQQKDREGPRPHDPAVATCSRG